MTQEDKDGLIPVFTSLWKTICAQRIAQYSHDGPPGLMSLSNVTDEENQAILLSCMSTRDEVHESEINELFARFAKVKHEYDLWSAILGGVMSPAISNGKLEVSAGPVAQRLFTENPHMFPPR